MYTIKHDDKDISDSDAICATAKKLGETFEYIKKIWEDELSKNSASQLYSKFEAEYTEEDFLKELESINNKI